MALRLVMMGTGHFALPTFRGLIESPHDVVGLFTQPDRTGRGHHKHVNVMKELAVENEIPVFQPAKVNTTEALADLASLNCDLAVVAAYGQILSAELLATPKLGAINLHGSILPKYRGAAPIQYAVRCGETKTGVTIFQIEPKLDAGPILGVVKTEIGEHETSGELHDRLAELTVPLAVEIVNQIESGDTQPSFQDPSLVTKAPRLRKEEGKIDWNQSAKQISCHIRAMQPWPKPSTHLLIADAEAASKKTIRVLLTKSRPVTESVSGEPGSIHIHDVDGAKRLLVQTGDGTLEILTIQPEGKRPMEPAVFLNGRDIPDGSRFGTYEP